MKAHNSKKYLCRFLWENILSSSSPSQGRNKGGQGGSAPPPTRTQSYHTFQIWNWRVKNIKKLVCCFLSDSFLWRRDKVVLARYLHCIVYMYLKVSKKSNVLNLQFKFCPHHGPQSCHEIKEIYASTDLEEIITRTLKRAKQDYTES